MSLTTLANALDRLSVLRPHVVSLLQHLPTVTKYLVALLFLLNIRSWPLAWHVRVFRPVFAMQIEHKLVVLQQRLLLRSRAARLRAVDQWLDSKCALGEDPLTYTVKYTSFASIDDIDFNGHLSNSSYAKTMDAARFKAALAMFPMFFVAGGWIPLAATHYSFIREIPMFASYEIRLTIATWDQKWFYIVAKFVTKPKKGRKKGTPTTSTSTTTVNTSAPVTPIPGTTPPSDKTPQDTSEALKAAAASLAGGPEPDGAILHTVVVSQCCFKIGRITVPPGIVFAVNGFSASPPSSVSPSQPSAQTAPEISPAPRYSRTNPPPHWPRAKAVMSHPRGGSPRALAALFAGGWRNVPQAERWWDTAMGGSVEERRVKALEQINALGVGMAGARGV